MLAPSKVRRQPAARQPFRSILWDDEHPEFQQLDRTLPHDHHARWLVTVVQRLDLTSFRASYAGYGSLAYPVAPLLAFVLFMYSQGLLSPARWVRHARYDDQAKWLLRGLRPSRSQLYTFRDRVEPFLDHWHQQLLAWAFAEGLTTATRGSLDGTFVAALASRHQLMSSRRVDRRLLFLRLLLWWEDGHPPSHLARSLARLPVLAFTAACVWLELLTWTLPPEHLLETLQRLLALWELLSPAGLPSEPAALDDWQPQLPAWMPATPTGRQRVLRRYEAAQQRLAQKLLPYQQKKKLSKKDQKTVKRLRVSLTDPEAVLGWDKNGTYRPLYNVPLVQATDAPLTLAWDVLPRNNDDGLLQPMMEKTHAQLGRHLGEVLVDGAFVAVADVAWCERQGVVVYAPPQQVAAVQEEIYKNDIKNTKVAITPLPVASDAAATVREAAVLAVPAPVGANDHVPATVVQENTTDPTVAPTRALPAAPVPGSARAKTQLPKRAFRYDHEEKVYYCPQGKPLPEAYRTSAPRLNKVALPVIVHRASGTDCQACPQQHKCTSNPKRGRVVKRYEGEEAVERLEQRMQEPANQQIYRQRSRSVELGYADLKEHRGLRIFRCFGLQRARAQAGLVILASNGLKIMRLLQQRAQPPLTPQRQEAA
jgi:transposase